MRRLLGTIFESLNDPFLVARVQSFFGLKLIKILDKSSDIDGSKSSTKPNCYEMSMVDKNKTCLYLRSSQFFYYFFMIMTGLGNEYFYIFFLPMLMWNFDDKLAFLTTISWAFSMYLGQASKDILKIPRPATPPVIKLEFRFLKEWGFPSTHAMAATSISLTLLSLLFQKYDTPEFYIFRIFSLTLGIFLSFSICVSRLYLGMHSVLDILIGILYALLLSFVFLSYSNLFFVFVTKSIFNGCLAYVAIYCIGLAYPCSHRNQKFKSTARSDTFLILGKIFKFKFKIKLILESFILYKIGVAGGVTLAISLRYSLNFVEMGLLNQETTIELKLLRFFVGAFCVQSARFIGKKILYIIINLFAKVGNRPVLLKEFIQSRFYFDLFFYYFNYTCVSFTAAFTCFLVFN